MGPSGPSFSFFSSFFSTVFSVFFLLFIFHVFSFLFISSFFAFLMFFIFFFFLKKVSAFLFSCISFKYVLLLASASEFNCFLRNRCSMEMWCPDDVGRDSGDWVGPPAWESMLQLPRVEWRPLACQNGASPDCIIVVVVEWLYYSKRINIVRSA